MRGDIEEADVAAYLHLLALRWVSGSNEGFRTEEACLHYRNSVALAGQLGLCHWRRQCGVVKLAIGGQNQSSRIIGGTEEGQGIQEASLQRLSRAPHCGPPQCHPVAERWLTSMDWLTSGGPLMLCGEPINMAHYL